MGPTKVDETLGERGVKGLVNKKKGTRSKGKRVDRHPSWKQCRPGFLHV